MLARLVRCAVAAFLVFASLAQAQELALDARLNEQVLMVPGANGHALETTVFRPSGPGPFPLLVMNHGKQPGDPRLQPRSEYSPPERENPVRIGTITA